MARQDDQGDQIMMIFTTEFFEVQSSVTLEGVVKGVVRGWVSSGGGDGGRPAVFCLEWTGGSG
jgi:hypothetical protein